MGELAVLIGKRIRELRKQRGLRQVDMESSGLSYKYYQRIEAGKVNVTLKTLERIAEVLDIDVREIFTFLPAGTSEANELAASISRIINDDDEESIKKLNLFIKGIL